MQKDMHYYGTYAMARAAGIKPIAAGKIAACAQFVDDNAASITLKFGNGAWVESVATAHHTLDKDNLNLSDQRQVWIPFHFLPGNQGDTWTERLKCRMDSDIAREMVQHHLTFFDAPYAEELMGVAAHVYADTFAHYGFSGISSRGNKVINDSFVLKGLNPDIEVYVRTKMEAFKKKKGARLQSNFQTSVRGGEGFIPWLFNMIQSWFAETLSGALGHGSVATLPDRPYLEWEFQYERPDGYLQSLGTISNVHAIRPNPETFFRGCEALHSMFTQFRERRPDLDNGDYRQFDSIRDAVSEILSVQANMAGRIEVWQTAAKQGTIFGNGEVIPEYFGELWNEEWERFDGAEDSEVVLHKPIWHFYQAAAMHRTYVLRDLLPAHGIIVS